MRTVVAKLRTRQWILIASGISAVAMVAGAVALTLSHFSAQTVFEKNRVHRLTDGGCVTLGNLPHGWTPEPRRKAQTNLISFERGKGSQDWLTGVICTGDTRPYAKVYAEHVLGHSTRLPGFDVPGLQAWAADDGLVVYGDGPREPYKLVMECQPGYHAPWRGVQDPRICIVSDYRFPGPRLLTVKFPSTQARRATALVAQVELQASKIATRCPAALPVVSRVIPDTDDPDAWCE